MQGINLLVGADPELFVRKARGDRSYVSAHGLIPGTKEDPYRVECGHIQVDGMAVEYNIDPAANAEEFHHNNVVVLRELKRMVGDKFDLVAKPWAKFSKKVWDNAPQEAKILGCNPDFNAYSMTTNNPPNAELDFRTASGHIHIGWASDKDVNDMAHFADCCMMAKELDALLGLPSLILDPSNKRRELYGKPGAFRPKPYGMEYRVLSNFWVGSNKAMHDWIHSRVVEAFTRLTEGRSLQGRVAAKKFIDGEIRGESRLIRELRKIGVNVNELPQR